MIPEEKKRLFSHGEWFVIFILLLSFMDFYLYSMHLMVIAFAIYCVWRCQIPVASGVIPAIMLTVALTLFWQGPLFSPTVWMKRLVWPAAFLVGYGLMWPTNLLKETGDVSEKRANVLLFVAAIGFFIHILLNIYINTGMEETNRNTMDFWTGKNRAATGQAGNACVPLACFIAYLVRDKKMMAKIPAILAILAILQYNLTLASRTMTLTVVVLLVLVLMMSAVMRNYMTQKRRGRLTVLVMLVVALFAYAFNLGGFRELIEESALFGRMFDDGELSLQTSRWELKLAYIKNMQYSVFGGNHIYNIVGSYAHDVLLDTYDEAGFLALIAVIAMLVDGIAKLYRLLCSNSIRTETKQIFLCVYISVFITFAVEPILSGMPWLLMTYCFFNGVITGLLKNTYYSRSLSNNR